MEVTPTHSLNLLNLNLLTVCSITALAKHI